MSRGIKDLIARARDIRTAEVEVDGIKFKVREPSGFVHARYAQLWQMGNTDVAVAELLRHCVIDESNAPVLNDDQALALARAGGDLTMPIVNAVIQLVPSQKEPDAPAADGVPDLHAAGAPAV